MKTPSHPGEVLDWSVLEPLGFSVSEAAHLLAERLAAPAAVATAAASPGLDLALLIKKAFGSKADRMFLAADAAAQVRKSQKHTKVKPNVAKAAA